MSKSLLGWTNMRHKDEPNKDNQEVIHITPNDIREFFKRVNNEKSREETKRWQQVSPTYSN